ncbi:hypothetical protein RJ640_010847 [Escallonia rubra]|uniref:Glutamine amidotransferase domain-containing protein n=1 Tax=Escallonia rubra TaxID=112253 RepID=A0AA88UHW2_9ASTE|nr:hypothetical protein RJ640_010847 [Escallonia rubra]
MATCSFSQSTFVRTKPSLPPKALTNLSRVSFYLSITAHAAPSPLAKQTKVAPKLPLTISEASISQVFLDKKGTNPIVVIDNYDSFTYNLCQYMGELGCNFEVYRNDELTLYNLSSMANRVQIPSRNSALIAMIAGEDTITGFLLAGVGNVDLRRKTNYLIVDSKTTIKQIEDTFKEFTAREDIAIVLISQCVANMIRFLVDSYNKPVPAILEIPSKDHPYDPAHDSVLSRVKYLFSAESVASGRR